MNRRDYLGRVAALATLGTATGCLQSPGSAAPDDSTPTPAISTSFSAADGDCGSGSDAASVAFDDGSVTVDGSIGTSVPCDSAELERATLDGGTLEIRVAEVPADDDVACVECVGNVEYTATVRITGGSITRVRVIHVRGDEATSVTTAERP